MLFCLQDIFMLSVSIAFWVQKKYLNRQPDDKHLTSKMQKPDKKEDEKNAMSNS